MSRIQRFNFTVKYKPLLNSFAEINESVFEQDRYLDNLYQLNHKLVSSLHCVPIVINDNTISAGSLALLGNQPYRDAFLVYLLRKAGAILLGKPEMDEFASGYSGISS